MPNRSLVRLLSGFRQFREKFFTSENGLYNKLTTGGQSPKTLIIGCSDSRVDPAIMSSAEPGELFVVRNVANLVPPFDKDGGRHGVSAAIEFAVAQLKVETIIVLGHRQCGGIRALMFPDQLSQEFTFVHKWMKIASDAKERALCGPHNGDNTILWRLGELEAIRTSIENLKTFPFIQEAIETRNLALVGVYFDIEKGELLELDDLTGQYNVLNV